MTKQDRILFTGSCHVEKQGVTVIALNETMTIELRLTDQEAVALKNCLDSLIKERGLTK